MQLSRLIAKIAAVMYMSAGVGAFISEDHYRRIADDLYSNAGLIYLTGLMTVIIGFLIVHYHNRWTKNWTVLITILGWIALLKGIVLIVYPQFAQNVSESVLSGWGWGIFPYVSLCLGLLFAYFGFVSRAVPSEKPDADGGL
jgi:uncharacterized membrane protein HdeD (DUF308 family)